MRYNLYHLTQMVVRAAETYIGYGVIKHIEERDFNLS